MSTAGAASFGLLSPISIKAAVSRGRDTVLLVEDDESLAKLFVLLLQRCGFRVVHARNGADCVRLFDQNPASIALLLVDCNLPDAHGGSLCHRLRGTVPGLPVLLTSGRRQEALQELLAADGPTGFLPKPFFPGDVLPHVRALVAAAA